MITPFPCQWLIAVPPGKRLAIREQLQYLFQDGFE